jgi:DNA-binding transcriptional MerR regulator
VFSPDGEYLEDAVIRYRDLVMEGFEPLPKDRNWWVGGSSANQMLLLDADMLWVRACQCPHLVEHCLQGVSVSTVTPSSSSSWAARRPSARQVARLARRRATGGAAVLRPKEVCNQLAVSASTLRAWSTEFKDYLSPAAQVAPAPGRVHRRYTAADVEVLVHIGQLLHLGHRCVEVRRLLALPAGSSGDHARALARTGDAEREQRLRSLEEALARARRQMDSLEEQAMQYEQQLEAERAAHAETRRALLEVQRKLTAAQRAEKRLGEVVVGMHAQVTLLESEVNAPVWRRVFR